MLVILLDRIPNWDYPYPMKDYSRPVDGNKIKLVLDEQGRRQEWLAARLGVTPTTVNRWLKGKRRIDMASANRIAQELNVPLFFLMSDIPIGISAREGAAA
jgi:transcriptional regulator with XRE-family HTH domain